MKTVEKIAKEFAETLKRKKAAIILLYGEMGAGKTTFTSSVVRRLVKNAHPQSPTFSIINQYADNIFHMDLYRIKNESELENIGFYEIVTGNNLVFIEWPEKTSFDFKGCIYKVKIEVTGENKRKIIID